MKNTFIYLIGPLGVGKYTVGKIIAARIEAKLVDNHYSINPIFALIEQDGRTPLPHRLWQQVGTVRSAVLETIAAFSPRDWSFVFTHAASDDPSDVVTCREILSAAERRRARVIAVRLSCEPAELAHRVLSPERRLRMKEVDADAARANAIAPLFDPGCDTMVDIDTTTKTPQQVADLVLRAAAAMFNA
jgi:ribose 1,5-bisphosphokinase PhnN